MVINPNSKSSQIRRLLDEGKSVAEIAKELNSNYSFVYGVAKRHLNGETATTPKKDSISQKIRDMFDNGMKRGEIARELNVDYSFVFSVVKAHQKRKGTDEACVTQEIQQPVTEQPSSVESVDKAAKTKKTKKQ
jgi:DNA invertase Pin-like site-specific DNA recombinase